MLKTYLRKQQVAERYSTSVRNIDRMSSDGRIPAPTLKNGRTPLWDTAAIDAADRAATMRSPQQRRAEGNDAA
jgi:predicted DNA-binding transcriptional regulator AlpA